MKTVRFIPGAFIVLAVLSMVSLAQQRTFVSGAGDDANACTQIAPCRSFTKAISQVSSGGEVVALDSAGYSPFVISKPVSVIAAPGVYAGIAVISGNGVSVNLASNTDRVTLRGLTINNRGSHGSGISSENGGILRVEGCVVNGFSQGGSSAAALLFVGGGALEVKDSIFRDNYYGIYVDATFQKATATIESVRLEDNVGFGLLVKDGVQAVIRNSVASANASGISVFTAGFDAELDVENCVVSNNGNGGIVAKSNSVAVPTVRVSNSTVTGNGIGLWNAGSPAVLLTRGNNTVQGNTVANMSGTIGSCPPN
jgi:hypothetical protein